MSKGFIYLRIHKGQGYCFGKTNDIVRRDREYSKENPFVQKVSHFTARNMHTAEKALIRRTAHLRLFSNSKEWVRETEEILAIFAAVRKEHEVNHSTANSRAADAEQAAQARNQEALRQEKKRIALEKEEAERRQKEADHRAQLAAQAAKARQEEARRQERKRIALEKQAHKEAEEKRLRIESVKRNIQEFETKISQLSNRTYDRSDQQIAWGVFFWLLAAAFSGYFGDSLIYVPCCISFIYAWLVSQGLPNKAEDQKQLEQQTRWLEYSRSKLKQLCA